MRMFADEGELIEKYRRLSDEGRARISNQIECELRIDAEVAAKRQESQRKGIEAEPRRRLAYIMAVHRRHSRRIGMWSMHSGRHRI